MFVCVCVGARLGVCLAIIVSAMLCCSLFDILCTLLLM